MIGPERKLLAHIAAHPGTSPIDAVRAMYPKDRTPMRRATELIERGTNLARLGLCHAWAEGPDPYSGQRWELTRRGREVINRKGREA